jgi:hypothetical protein
MRRVFFLLVIAGCSAPAPFESERTLAFPAITVDAGEEVDWVCQSITLGNEDRLWVNSVIMDSGPSWHHANWFFVPDTMYEGPDGTWPCDERDYDPLQAAAVGGVFFAQSTQVSHDEQTFVAGAAFSIPPNSRIVGDVHLVNATGSPIDTAISLTMHMLRDSDVGVRLKPMSLIYQDLHLPPQASSRLTGNCPANGGNLLDFRVYYVLPHYHSMGTGFTLDTFGGPLGDVRVYETSQTIGARLGGTLDPPLDVSGSTGARFSCDFTNPLTTPVTWGNRDGEMCMFLAYTDSDRTWAGGVFDGNAVVGTAGDGRVLQEGPCGIVRL